MPDTTGFGVIGAGTWGELHARTYATTPGARLAALCDLDAARLAAVAAVTGGGATCYSDYHALLADPAVTAVSIVLPDYLHRAAAVAAAEAGKHILLEKPLATTEADALAILEAVRANGVTLMVDFHNRWSPPFHALKVAADSGELGALQTLSYRLNDTLFVPTQMLRWSARSSVAWFLASHCLDTLLWLTDARAGGDAVTRVYAVARSRVLRALGIDTPDLYQTILEFRSGLVVHLENAWILPEGAPSIFELKCEVIGDGGAYYIDGSLHGAQKITARTTYPDALVAPIVHGRPVGFAAESIRHFARAIIDGTSPLVDGLDGLAATRLVLAMEESAQRGEPVAVGDLWAI
ncbi:MAG: Gfo/Idh/MocA family oxidoreductase [Caldilineaceae bacterium]|nr:Gfo/Idh/MocA family oxidoreductase [Caldilineaceae bacterium]